MRRNYTIDDSTHLLHCTHSWGWKGGAGKIDYHMQCILIGTTKRGMSKILVFSDKNGTNRPTQAIRYVKPDRIRLLNTTDIKHFPGAKRNYLNGL